MAFPYFNVHSSNLVAHKVYGPAVSNSGSVLNDCPQRNGQVFGLEVRQTAPNNYLNTSNPYGESFHNPYGNYRFPKVLVRVLSHQEPEQSEPLGISNKTKAQQGDEDILCTGQSGVRIDRVRSMAVKANSQSHSLSANHSPLDSTLRGAAGNSYSGMGRSTLQISSVVDNNLHQPVHIHDQDRIDTFSKPEAPVAIITPQLNSEQLQQNTSSKHEFDFNASAFVSGESLMSSPDKASQKACLESERRKASRKAYEQSNKGKAVRKAYRQSDKGKASRKAYEQSDKGQAFRKAYLQSETRKASRKAYEQSDKGKASRKAYRQSENGKASRKAYNQSDKGKASRKVYRQSDKGKASLKAYRQSDKGKASLKAYRQSEKAKAYQDAYYKVFYSTGDRAQARIAGRQASAFIRKSNKDQE